MRNAAAALILIGLVAVPLGAQGRSRGGDRAKGIPPGHLPPAGACRVWYDGRPPGQQPRPTNCREAERIASRDRYARVIYGADRDGRNDRWPDRDDKGRDRDRPRAIPRSGYPDRYPDGRYPYPDRDANRRGGYGYGYGTVPFDNGHTDGYDKGREDDRDRDRYDPVRHSRYRSADRGYDRRYGSKDEYRNIYREGFRVGYDEGYRRAGAYDPDRRSGGGIRLPWPF